MATICIIRKLECRKETGSGYGMFCFEEIRICLLFNLIDELVDIA